MTARKQGKEQGKEQGKARQQVDERRKDGDPIGRMPEPGTPLGSPDEDARWTAWALGDADALDGADREAMAAAEHDISRDLEGVRDVAAAVKQAFKEERAVGGVKSAEDVLGPAARKAVLDAGARARPKAALPSRRKRLWLPGFGSPLQVAASLAVAFFLVIPALRWGMDRTPVGASVRMWFAAVTEPSMMDQGTHRDSLPDLPPRSFRELVPWPSRRDVSGAAGDFGTAGSLGGTRQLESAEDAAEDAAEGSSDEQSVVAQSAPGYPASRASGAVDAELADPTRKIVLTGRVRAEVEDVMRTADDISAWVVRRGGFVESSRTEQSSDGGGATLVLRIPRLEFDALRRTVRERAVSVLVDESDRVDNTTQHADQRERLKSLRSTEAELRELLEAQREAGRETKDVLEIFDLLKEYRSQIEGLEGQLGALEEQATLSTLTLELITHRPPVPTATPTATPVPESRRDRIGATVQSARGDLFDGLELVLRTALYLTIAILPPLLLLAAFLWIWWQGTHRVALWWSRTRPG